MLYDEELLSFDIKWRIILTIWFLLLDIWMIDWWLYYRIKWSLLIHALVGSFFMYILVFQCILLSKAEWFCVCICSSRDLIFQDWMSCHIRSSLWACSRLQLIDWTQHQLQHFFWLEYSCIQHQSSCTLIYQSDGKLHAQVILFFVCQMWVWYVSLLTLAIRYRH